MKKLGIPYLMYHELEVPGRDLQQNEPGYVHYVVTSEEFFAQLNRLLAAGFRGVSVTEALADNNQQHDVVCITFDDGCETDLLVAAPLLKELGFGATFYVVAGFVGSSGYLSANQLRKLHQLGFEIGSHSMTHSYLPHLNADELRVEIFHSKDCLEQLVGCRVDHFSCPGGRWQARISELAKAAGYLSVATSEIGTNWERTDHYRLARLAIFRGTSTEAFMRLCHGQRLFSRRFQNFLLNSAKHVLGDTRYEQVRTALLRGTRSSKTNALGASRS